MDRIKSKSAMLMTKGIVDMRQNPPGLVCTIRKFRHPETLKEVTLFPVPTLAAPHYFRRVFDTDALARHYDKILFEDGRLPFAAGSPLAAQQRLLRRLFPFLGLRPVAADGSRFDGIVQRDPIESRMAHQMLLDGQSPPVDPRARRAVERIDSYAEGARVACPWGVYHIVYMQYKLAQLGYVVESEEEVEVVGVQEALLVFAVLATITLWMTYALFRLLVW